MLLTIGIPAYDAWPKLRRMLRSLLTQRTDWTYEIILVDDCHPDDLCARVRAEFPSVRAQRNHENQGPAYNRNRIIEQARAPYIAFFDADCIVPEGWIESVRPHLNEARLLSGRVVRPDGSLEWGPRRATWLGVSRPCALEQANVASSNNMVVPTAMARAIGGFNEGLRIYFEDSLFSLEFRRAGGEIQYLPEAEVVHDHHSLRSAGRLRLQSRNTLWAMHHYYRGRPLRRMGCAAGLSVNYVSKALLNAAMLRFSLSGALLRGTLEGHGRILRGQWRDRWVAG